MANLSKIAKIAITLITFGLMIILTACGQSNIQAPFAARIEVMGDVQSPYLFTGEGFDAYSISDQGIKYQAISLKDVIEKSLPINESYTVLFIGRDGLASEIEGTALEQCHLAYTPELGWQHITDYFPISSRVKLLDKIVVISTDSEKDGVHFAGGTTHRVLSAGSIYKESYESLIVKNGQSQLNGQSVRVYTKDITIALDALLDYEKTLAIFTQEGAVVYDRPNENSRIIIKNNKINYQKSSKEIIENVKGVLADPPLNSITDVYHDTLSFVDKGEKVMVIELDGWGSLLAENAEQKGYSPFLQSYEKSTVISAYPTISPVGLAAMLTGKNGNENGIISRDTKALLSTDIFEVLKEKGKTMAYIEGNISLIDTSFSPKLSPETAVKDQGIYENTLKAIEQNVDFIFTHFHSIDDVATAFGPYHTKTLEQVLAVDKMVQELVAQFEGTVIITADHGLHPVAEGGAHGIVSKEDCLVPYLIIKEE